LVASCRAACSAFACGVVDDAEPPQADKSSADASTIPRQFTFGIVSRVSSAGGRSDGDELVRRRVVVAYADDLGW
jgi:hypothetical protein